VLEPGTAHPLQRLRAVRELNDAGVRAGVLMAPVVPGFTSQPARLERTIKAIADHGAAFMGANVLYLKDGTRTHFMGFLEKNFPGLFIKYQKLYPGAYAPKSYAKEVQAIVKLLQDRHGLNRRGKKERPDDEDESSIDENQSSFEWK
jgi:DNA repair photolyase